MKTTVYIIRHGQSKANEVDVFLGHHNMDLTAQGYLQAQKTAAFFKDIPVDVIYSSDLTRAYETARATAALKNLPITKNENLREIAAGDWEEKPFDELRAENSEEFRTWIDDFGHARCPKGESVEELQTRFVGEVEKLAKENIGKTICVFAHATPIRVLKAAWDGKDLNDIKEVPWPSNASVTEAEYKDGVFRILQYSRDDFLEDLVTVLPENI